MLAAVINSLSSDGALLRGRQINTQAVANQVYQGTETTHLEPQQRRGSSKRKSNNPSQQAHKRAEKQRFGHKLEKTGTLREQKTAIATLCRMP